MSLLRIACVGSRETPPDVLQVMERLGGAIVRARLVLVSGNAPKADQAWARGANAVNAHRVELCLPWAEFEAQSQRMENTIRVLSAPVTARHQRYVQIAQTVHGRGWGALSPGTQRLFARNAMIVEGAIAAVGWSNPDKVSGGGTGMAFRVARFLKVPVFDMRKIPEFADRFLRDLEALAA